MVKLIESMIEYAQRHGDKILLYTMQHIQILIISLVISFAVACLMVVIMRRLRFLQGPVDGLVNAIFAIPSLAMFSFLIPFTGLGTTTAVTALVLYSQFILIKSINNAFDSIDPSVIEAADGMGMSPSQVMLQVKIPLALPAIVSGLKMCMVATVAMSTLAANIGAGGLGVLLFHGLAMKKWNHVGWGVIISTAMGILLSVAMQHLEDYTLRKSRGEVKVKKK